MVGPLAALKMMHCRIISRSSKIVSLKRKKDTHWEGTSRDGSTSVMNAEVKLESPNELCRVCLREGNLPIFDETDDLVEAIRTFGAIEVTVDDSYPKHLCQACHALLQGAILFRKTAQQSDETLKKSRQPDSEPDPEPDEDSFCYASGEVEVEFNYKENNDKITKILKCKKCDIQFNSFQEYSEHRLSLEHENKRHVCPICNNSYAPDYIKRHIALHKREPTYMCDICGKKFLIQSQFTRHHLTHFYSLPFKCAHCPYKGRFRESLKMHMRTHTGEKPYQCTECPSRFINKSNLSRHLLTHKGVRDFRCEVCGRGFYTKRNLEMHFKVDHAGIKEHVCKICDKAFGYRKQMMKHALKVHKREKMKSGRMPIYLRIENLKPQDDDGVEIRDDMDNK